MCPSCVRAGAKHCPHIARYTNTDQGRAARVSHMLRCGTFFLTAPASAALDIRIARHLGSAGARRRRTRRWRRWRWRRAHRAGAALAPAAAVRRAAPRRALRGLAVSRAGRRAGFSCSSGRVRRAHRNEQRGRARHMDAHRGERRVENRDTESNSFPSSNQSMKHN